MRNSLTKAGRDFAFKQNMLAISIVIILTLLICYFWGFDYAKSALVGGFVVIIPNIVFAYKAFKYAGAQSSKKVVDSFFSGVKLKMGLTAFLFALAFKFLVLLPVPFFSMFCLVVALPLVTPLLLRKSGNL
ncbi:ATP synthase subunit I [Litorilituus sediminis]|uniref:F0F1 ATP synthase assembly protein I n=1 Tax=Litorilituus sediminis TaxID=718192 RepID=A0A4P6P9N7_9GAMM|nr:ATP synthase subunit I [Litorilituus sediminis]QBG36265.1 F0F1 ATP synthase assembly protein I [Litorilituus sediminis]